MKEIFEEPKFDVIYVDDKDIIMTSGPNCDCQKNCRFNDDNDNDLDGFGDAGIL